MAAEEIAPEPIEEPLRPAAYAGPPSGGRLSFGRAAAEPQIETPGREIREPVIEEPRNAYGDEAGIGDRPIARIIDPLVADDDVAQPDLYLDTPVAGRREPIAAPEPEPDYAEEPRRGGWRSLFGGGRPRYEEKPAQQFGRARPELRPTQQAEPEIEAAPEGQDDLEIPSFLRRLAN